MANHAKVVTKKYLTPELVHVDLKEIIKRRFKDKLSVEFTKYNKPNSKSGDWRAHWIITPINSNNFRWDFEISLLTVHTIDFRHPHGDWAFWAQTTIINELAYKYNGIISDEGVSGTWTADLNKYPTYKSWVKGKYKGIKFGWVISHIEMMLNDAPKL